MSEDRDGETRRRYLHPADAAAYQAGLRHPVARSIAAGERTAVRRCVVALGAPPATWLDVAGGAGKLRGVLPGRRISADVSPAMLALDHGEDPRVVADATALPMADDVVDVAVVLRLLHACGDAMLTAVVAEALRVARRGAVVSDTVPAPPWRSGLRRALGRAPERGGRDRVHLDRLIQKAGGRIVAAHPTLPLLSSGHLLALARGGQRTLV